MGKCVSVQTHRYFFAIIQLYRNSTNLKMWLSSLLLSGTTLAVLLAGASICNFFLKRCSKNLHEWIASYCRFLVCWWALCLLSIFTLSLETQLLVKLYLELGHVTDHSAQCVQWLGDSSMCLRQESAEALQRIKEALLQEDQVKKFTRAIEVVKSAFDAMKKAAENVKGFFSGCLSWLDARGLTCMDMTKKVYDMCMKSVENSIKNCESTVATGFKAICQVVRAGELACMVFKPVAGFVCKTIVPAVLDGLERLRKLIAAKIANFTRMRVMFEFKKVLSTGVSDFYSAQWEKMNWIIHTHMRPFKQMQILFQRIMDNYTYILNYGFPLCYLLCFRFSKSFDNLYIYSGQESSNKMPTSLKLRPLNYREKLKYKVVPSFWPNKYQAKRIFAGIFLSMEFVMPIFTIFNDVRFTNSLLAMHEKSHQMLDDFQGELFRIPNTAEKEGFSSIVRGMLESLERFQKAADFKQFKRCVIEVPPYNYTIHMFVVLFLLRLWISYFKVMFNWLPNWICSYIYARTVARERFLCLKMKILDERIDQQLKYGDMDSEDEESSAVSESEESDDDDDQAARPITRKS